MRNRSASLNKRLACIEKSRDSGIAVKKFPICIALDIWGELAVNMQHVLKANIKEDTAPDYVGIPNLELVASDRLAVF